MIAELRSWLIPAGRRPHRVRSTARPVVETLEPRAVLSVSVAANIGRLTPSVVGVSLPQPSGFGTQEVSLILRPSADDPQLFRDSLTGKSLGKVTITVADGRRGKDVISLRNAVITSYQTIQDPIRQEPTIALTLEGRTGRTGSIAANIDGVKLAVVKLMIPQTNSPGSQEVSLEAKLSQGVPKLFQDAVTGKAVSQATITLDRIGNSSRQTMKLMSVLITSIQYVGSEEVPGVDLVLDGLQATIRRT